MKTITILGATKGEAKKQALAQYGENCLYVGIKANQGVGNTFYEFKMPLPEYNAIMNLSNSNGFKVKPVGLSETDLSHYVVADAKDNVFTYGHMHKNDAELLAELLNLCDLNDIQGKIALVLHSCA